MGRKNSTLWNFFFLNVGFIISIINGVLIVPLYLHYINSSLYGAWLATGNILTWITMVDPGVSGVLLQKMSFAIGKNDSEEVGLLVTSGMVISIILFILAIILGLILSYLIVNIAKIDRLFDKDIVSAFRISIWGTGFYLISHTFAGIILAFQKTKLVGLVNNIVNVLGIILTITMLINGWGIFSLSYAILLRGVSIFLCTFIISTILLNKNNIKYRYNLNYIISFSKIFSYTFGSRIFETISSNIDLIIVSRYIGTDAVTILDLSRRPIKIITGLANNVTISMLPALANLFGSSEIEKLRTITVKIWIVILWISGFIISGFILFGQSITTNWVGKEFWIGNLNNFIMCFSFLLLSIGYNLSNVTYSMGDIKNNSLISIVRNIFYLIFLLFLTQWIGITGVLLAFLIPLGILLAYYPQKTFKITNLTSDDLKKIIIQSLVTGGIMIFCMFLSIKLSIVLSWTTLIIFSIGYGLLYLAIIYSTSNLFRESLFEIRQTILNKI